MHASAKNTLKGLAFVSPWLAGFFFFLLLPIALSLYYSFHDYALIQRTPPGYVGLDNFRQMAGDPLFWRALGNTFKYAALAVPAGLGVSLVFALLLNAVPVGAGGSRRAQAAFRTILFLPSLIPAVAAAVLWAWLFNSRVGLINAVLSPVLGLFGARPPNWLADHALPSLALMSLWSVGYTVVILLAGLQNIPRELYEAAEIDGASALRRLWHVTLPTLSPVIFFNLIMSLIATFQVFTVPTLMIKAGLRADTQFFSMYLFDQAFTYNHMGYASAMAWVQLVIILGLTGVAFWTSKRWVHYR
jgi:multiple sugar transport system permease protein